VPDPGDGQTIRRQVQPVDACRRMVVHHSHQLGSDEQTVRWAAKIAVACRSAQQVLEFMPSPDPEPDAMHRRS